MNPTYKKGEMPKDFNAISLKLASPERIREWSFGEVTKPETVNYRTQRSERNGLFDERIFGPEKDYECYCGKYRRIRYKDIICERCGVEVTKSIVRRERMGHIELATPVAHIWFLRGIPSRMGTLLDISVGDLEKVIYFSGYIITRVNAEEKARLFKDLDTEYKTKAKNLQTEEGKEKLKQVLTETKKEIESIDPGLVLDEVKYHKFSMKYGPVFEADIGSEAIFRIFREMDLAKLQKEVESQVDDASAVDRVRIQKRINLIKGMRRSSIRPEWMFLTVIPVIPPALRPMVALDGGRHATSDVNDLYRRVINRNNRLKKLVEIKAPDVIQRNEKRILQEAVDALIDNSINQATGAVSSAQRRPLKSLSDALKGKQGRFRQNLLGKRVDYSGRSVIVVGPEMKLHQCGLPKHMALELFRPFVIAKLLERELAFNIRGAGKLIDEGIAEVWEILEEVIANKYVLLNRAPTLHRLGIQAFQPVLIEGDAIQVHPLVCEAYNADFDGDQMAVHLPLSNAAQKEARTLMAANHNLLKPANNEATTKPKQDIVVGCYWMTKIMGKKDSPREELRYFGSPDEAILAYDYKAIDLRERILVLPPDGPKFKEYEGKLFETTVGRLLFNSVLPEDFPFLNTEIKQKLIGDIVQDLIAQYGIESVPPVLDKIKTFGFAYATKSGLSWGIDDVKIPEGKKDIVASARKKIGVVEANHEEGLISDNELYRMSIEIWREAKSQIDKLLPATLAPDGPVATMIDSGARGSITNVSQMAGMKGLIVNPQNEIINFPIIPSYLEGLSPLEYFVDTHGARKGLSDTALNTAKAGYITRKLVYVADSAIITEEDCGDTEGRLMSKIDQSGLDTGIMNLVRGRILLAPAKDKEGKVVFPKGHLLYKRDAKLIEERGVVEALVRSPLSCKTLNGLCRMCYGLDLARNKLVEIGEPVGVVAAQAIGEPGTQLTMRTFHQGGIASVEGDITMGLPRVEEVLERRAPKVPAAISEVNGTVMEIESNQKEKTIKILPDVSEKKKGKEESAEYVIPAYRMFRVAKGDIVKKGEIISDGPANIADLFKLGGRGETERYILKEINKIYELQGVAIARKHIEIVVRQMFSRRKIVNPGDTTFVVGETVSDLDFTNENGTAKKHGGEEATAEKMILGISDISLSSSSFLAAAAFENTQRILTETAVKGRVDRLVGIKENVLIGRLIPAGTGLPNRREEFEPAPTEEMIEEERRSFARSRE